MKQVVIAVDLGGTNTVFGVVDKEGKVLHQTSFKTQAYPEISAFVTRCGEAVSSLLKEVGGAEQVKAIGIGAPDVNYWARTIENATNLPWKGIVPLAELLEKETGISVRITNDAKAAALGEMLYGAAKGMKDFIITRKGDQRDNPVNAVSDLYCGDIFYITCIDDEYQLAPFYEKYRNQYHCVFQRDIYSNEQWLEFMPQAASKSNAINQLKDHLRCDRIVVFGDGKNDIDMFSLADECYAVENAVDELKSIATAVIPQNNDDGVAKWLLENYNPALSKT